jgi:hypothetical protein
MGGGGDDEADVKMAIGFRLTLADSSPKSMTQLMDQQNAIVAAAVGCKVTFTLTDR